MRRTGCRWPRGTLCRMTRLICVFVIIAALFTAAVDALERDGGCLKAEADEARKAAGQSHIGR